jgi:alpha-ketoglutarate-dependent taurine dioxygenase
MPEALSPQPLCQDLGYLVRAEPATTGIIPEPDQVGEWLETHGAVVFRGFVDGADAFVQFTDRYGRDFSTYQGGWFYGGAISRRTVGDQPTLFTATGKTQEFAIPLHGEMYYQKHKPSLLWFYCHTPPARMGQTTLCDGRALWRGLSGSARESLEARRIKYINTLTRPEWEQSFHSADIAAVEALCARNDVRVSIDPATQGLTMEYVCPAVVTGPTGELAFINSLLILWRGERLYRRGAMTVDPAHANDANPPTIVRWEDGAELSHELMKEVGAVAKRLTVDVEWERGDILLVDNTRVMHGRRDSPESGRVILVRMSDPGWTAARAPAPDSNQTSAT